jgi:hypothetical protein
MLSGIDIVINSLTVAQRSMSAEWRLQLNHNTTTLLAQLALV